MKTSKYIDNLLKQLWEKSGLDAEYEPAMKEIRAAISERDEILKSNSAQWHDDDAEEFDYKPLTSASPSESEHATPLDGTDWKSMYESMEQRYKDTFFSGGKEPTTQREPDPFTPQESNKSDAIPLDDLIRYDE